MRHIGVAKNHFNWSNGHSRHSHIIFVQYLTVFMNKMEKKNKKLTPYILDRFYGSFSRLGSADKQP